ncbi:hypothetical protein Tco_1097605 [Tanacetum coccineum]
MRQNKGLQAFMDRFKSEGSHIKGVPSVLRISAFMHGHGHPELAKKLNDKIPKTVDEMFERVRAFIRGEVAAGSAEMVRPSQGDKGKDTFTPLIKTLKEILAIESVSFPEPPPLIRTPKKQSLNKLCDYHRDRGHNTNDCYQLKKQIKEVVASRKLAHLVKDIRRNNQQNWNQGRNGVKVINMIREEGKLNRPFEEGRFGLMNELIFLTIPQSQLMNEPIILEGIVKGNQVRMILVDGGSLSEIMKEESPPEHPKDKSGLVASAKLTWAELNKRSRDADLSKDKSGPESPPEFQRSWYVEGHIRSGVISSVLAQRHLRNSPAKARRRRTKLRRNQAELDIYHCLPRTISLRQNMTDSQSPKEGARRTLPEFEVIGQNPWSVASFLPDNGHPSPTLVNQIENTSRTINIKPNKRPWLKKKPCPSPLPEQIFAPTTQQMSQIRKRSSKKQNFSANHEGKHKSINGKRPEQAELVQLGTIVGMIRGNRSRGSSSEVMYEHCFRNLRAETRAKLKESRTPFVGVSGEEVRSCGIHYPLNDKIPHRQRDCNNDNEERNSPRMPKDERSTMTSHGREDHPFPITSTGFRKNDEPGQKKKVDGKRTKQESQKTPYRHPAYLRNKLKQMKKLREGTNTLKGLSNASLRRRSELIKISQKHADAFTWTPADMTGIPRSIAEHELKTYPYIEPRMLRKRSIAPNKRRVVKDEVTEWLKA